MESVVDRIRKIMDHENISVKELEIKLESSRGFLSKTFTRNNDIGSKWLVKLVTLYPKLSARWLLTGEGSMIEVENEYVREKALKLRIKELEDDLIRKDKIIAMLVDSTLKEK